MVLESIKGLSEKGRYMKTSEIIENVEKHVGKPVNHERVHTILRTLEDFGFISREVISKENVPYLVWKIELETENDEIDPIPH
jgi:hypothetical protein